MQSVEKLLFTSQRTQFHLEGFISLSVPHLHSACAASFALTAGEKTPGWVCSPKINLISAINVKGFGLPVEPGPASPSGRPKVPPVLL